MINNYHTHTFLCDGKHKVEEYVLEALKLGCEEIGFSGHSYAPWDSSCLGMNEEKLEQYKEAIEVCKNKYRDIKIYRGIELDYYSNINVSDFDYVIGAVHYVKKGEDFIPVDYSVEALLNGVKKHYNGDFFAFINDYYDLVSKLYNQTKCNIVAHVDLITKLNKNQILFNESDPIYRNLAKNSVEKLLKTPCVFEVNTGGIQRGYKDGFYPDSFLLDIIGKSKKPLVLSSDCHDSNYLLFELENAKKILDQKGFSYIKSLKEIL